MSKCDNPCLLSLKYLTASFVATYCSGVVHPLDLIKTRFQSTHGVRKVMMGEVQERMWCLGTAGSRTH
jgi:hypothetical protein